MIDVVSEQRGVVVVVADAFVIVLGQQMFTRLLRFNPLQYFVFSRKRRCSVNKGVLLLLLMLLLLS